MVKKPSQQEEALPLEERILRAIMALHAAFEDCPRPGVDREFYGVLGLEWGDMRRHWMPWTREDVEVVAELDVYRCSDDLDVMSTVARRYFFPAIMVWILSHPGKLDGLDFGIFLRHMESMWVKEEEKLLRQLLQLKECLPKAVKLTDFDQDQREEMAQAKLKAAGGVASRRRGWKRYKGKEGHRPRE